MKLAPSGLSYWNLINAYLYLGRLDEAKATAQEAQARNFDDPMIHLHLYQVAFLQHDARDMERESAELMGKRGWEDVILHNQSDTAAYSGHFAQARELTWRAASSARHADKKEAAAAYEAEAAVRE